MGEAFFILGFPKKWLSDPFLVPQPLRGLVLIGIMQYPNLSVESGSRGQAHFEFFPVQSGSGHKEAKPEHNVLLLIKLKQLSIIHLQRTFEILLARGILCLVCAILGRWDLAYLVFGMA